MKKKTQDARWPHSSPMPSHRAWLTPLVMAALLGGGLTAHGDVLLAEDFDSYEPGAWPDGFYQFGYDYEHFPGTHVVAAPSAECPYSPVSSPNCFMVTNPYSWWGGDIKAPFAWENPSAYEQIVFEADVLFPASSSTGSRNDVGIRLYRWEGNVTLAAIGLGTGQPDDPDPPPLAVYADDGGSAILLSEDVQFDEWVHLKGVVDIGSDTYDVYVNGVRIGEGLSLNPSTTAIEADTFFFSKGFRDPAPGFFDNVCVEAVPEPAGALALLLGAACLRRRG